MSLTKEAIQYLTELGIRPDERLVEFENDRLFSVDADGTAKEIFERVFNAETLEINTLTGLVAYVEANLERIDNPLILQVANEKTVHLLGLIEKNGSREKLVSANAIIPNFPFGRFIDSEEFIIAFQSKFVPTEDRDILLQVVGNVVEENVKNTGDNGYSQSVEIKDGLASKAEVLVPNPVTLAPYRTFLEVEQPESEFIFRMEKGPKGAIFEADGGAWRNQAITNIREYLTEQLLQEINNGRITIIA